MVNTEIQSILRNLQNVNSGQPWFGRSVYAILDEVDPPVVFIRPGNTEHSLIELLYHMLTWATFVLKQAEGGNEKETAEIEALDWRNIDPELNSWEKGLKEFKSVHSLLIQLLQEKDDDFLSKKVAARPFNFRFMLNGLIQHNIYHLGQIAYVRKLLAKHSL